MISRYTSMAVFLALVVLAAAAGSSFEAGEWYYKLYKPSWTPPAWLLATVWASLYLMMAMAAWKIWLTGHFARNGALIWWTIQLLMLSAWSWLFFGLERPGWAWMEISLLIVMVVLCIKVFSPLSKSATYLMLPYLVWLLFIWFLNLVIWSLNGGLLARLL